MAGCKTRKQTPSSHSCIARWARMVNHLFAHRIDAVMLLRATPVKRVLHDLQMWARVLFETEVHLRNVFFFLFSEWTVAVGRFWQQLEKDSRHGVSCEMVRSVPNRWFLASSSGAWVKKKKTYFVGPKWIRLKEIFLVSAMREVWRIGLLIGRISKHDIASSLFFPPTISYLLKVVDRVGMKLTF